MQQCKAKQAHKLAQENEFVNLELHAEEILEKGNKIIERDRAVAESLKELSAYASKKVMRIAVNVSDKQTYVTLPFRKRNTEYPKLEKPLVENINAYLDSSKLEYTQEDFHGLLRYNIIGIKKRARNKLITTINSTQDIFLKLCGQREAIRIETC